ncbi:IS30 family transposase [Pseudophaeobacter sp.]|uniref:IS30 family transposase n=1 Tax=Pseudophaeobacter sp. TaxID=1971739 RepID=UPI00329807E1
MKRTELNLAKRHKIEDLLHRKVKTPRLHVGSIATVRPSIVRSNVASLLERKPRFAVLFRNNDRSSKPFMAKLTNVMEPLPQIARQSIPFDRGIEFSGWRRLEPEIGTGAWFCGPQAPWQKGSVENLNKRARRYLPRDTPIAALSNRDMKAICDRLNGTPRKCLGWRTPTEAFTEELRKLAQQEMSQPNLSSQRCALLSTATLVRK